MNIFSVGATAAVVSRRGRQLPSFGRNGALPNNMSEGTLDELMKAADTGDDEQRQQLFATLYNELHGLAQRQLQRSAQATLSPTTLLHETFMNVCFRDSAPTADRGRFMAYAA